LPLTRDGEDCSLALLRRTSQLWLTAKKSPATISSAPSAACRRLTQAALRPLTKSIQTLLSTTITQFLALCGSARGCRASGISRTPTLPLSAVAA
jgi:hypothetical protein